MAEYIEREALIKSAGIFEAQACARGYGRSILHLAKAWLLNEVNKAPTADVVEVVHGHWTSTDIISKKAGYGVRYYRHEECKVAPCKLFECEYDYCPCCGAKMDGV